MEIIESRTRIEHGSESGSREKAFQHAVTCAYLVESALLFQQHIGIRWQLETDDGAVLFQRMSFRYLSAQLVLVFHSVVVFHHIRLRCGREKGSRGKH